MLYPKVSSGDVDFSANPAMKKTRSITAFLCFTAFWGPSAVCGQERITSVIDGATVRTSQRTVQIEGIKAPSLRGSWGRDSKDHLSRLLRKGNVQIVGQSLYVDGADVALTMVQDIMADALPGSIYKPADKFGSSGTKGWIATEPFALGSSGKRIMSRPDQWTMSNGTLVEGLLVHDYGTEIKLTTTTIQTESLSKECLTSLQEIRSLWVTRGKKKGLASSIDEIFDRENHVLGGERHDTLLDGRARTTRSREDWNFHVEILGPREAAEQVTILMTCSPEDKVSAARNISIASEIIGRANPAWNGFNDFFFASIPMLYKDDNVITTKKQVNGFVYTVTLVDRAGLYTATVRPLQMSDMEASDP